MTETILATLVAEAAIISSGQSNAIDRAIRRMAQTDPERVLSASMSDPSFYDPIKEWLCENAPTYGVSDILPDDVAVAFRLTFL